MSTQRRNLSGKDSKRDRRADVVIKHFYRRCRRKGIEPQDGMLIPGFQTPKWNRDAVKRSIGYAMVSGPLMEALTRRAMGIRFGDKFERFLPSVVARLVALKLRWGYRGIAEAKHAYWITPKALRVLSQYPFFKGASQ